MRKELGIAENVKVVVFNFGGQVGHLLSVNSISLGHMFLFSHLLMFYIIILKCLLSSISPKLNPHNFFSQPVCAN